MRSETNGSNRHTERLTMIGIGNHLLPSGITVWVISQIGEYRGSRDRWGMVCPVSCARAGPVHVFMILIFGMVQVISDGCSNDGRRTWVLKQLL